MSVIRFTVVDYDGAASFLGPAHAIKMLVAACSRNPVTMKQLLEMTVPYDSEFVDDVRSGLAVFDEHNTTEDLAAFHEWAKNSSTDELPPFRIVDETTRNLSLEPEDTGLVVFNLKEQRIIQVQNSYAEVQRQDRGRVRRNGEPTRMLYKYQLPDTWRIVP